MKIKFPLPKDCKQDNPAVICPGERVLGLYNHDSGESAKRISKKVRMWFAAKALDCHWAGVHFMKEVQTNFGAGCVLWLPAPITIEVTKNTLVLVPQSE